LRGFHLLSDFITHIASDTGLSQKKAKAALGIVLNAADRQGTPFATEIFERIPGARTLAADMGASAGVATGVIARLIEQTPGGKRAVTEQTIRNLQKEGLGNNEIGALFPAISAFAGSVFGIAGVGHLGDIFGQFNTVQVSGVRSVA
jgi:hypothetical protein